MWTIDKGVPLPCPTAKRLARPRRDRRSYPWPSMEPGDSVFFPDEPDGHSSGPARAARNYVRRGGQGKRFTARAENGGVRIWRVE